MDGKMDVSSKQMNNSSKPAEPADSSLNAAERSGAMEALVPISPSERPVQRATGPRTELGKRRSSSNATKHGIFSKAILINGESRAELQSLLRQLREYHQPVGVTEELLVEKLATLIWRQRRLLKAESAEIAKRTEFIDVDTLQRLVFETDELKKSGNGMLHQLDNPIAVGRAAETLEELRASFEKEGFDLESDIRVIRALYGSFGSNDIPPGFPSDYINFGLMTDLKEKAKDWPPTVEEALKAKDWPLIPEEARTRVIKCLDREARRLKRLKKRAETVESRRRAHSAQAMLVPEQNVLDCLQRYEGHLSREFDRTLNQLERLQRMRRGQPSPPSIQVNLSS